MNSIELLKGGGKNEDQNQRMACFKRGGTFYEDLSSICEEAYLKIKRR
ncbi:hypothetical protein CHCC14598_1372 [Bacillus licheniformis]|nr:hypothetical protein CHCC14598_1372 [Bacillus licheniformis]